MKKYILSAAVLAAICLTACTEEPKPEQVMASERLVYETLALDGPGHLYTINQLLDTYMTEKGNFKSDSSLYRTRAEASGGVLLFSIDTLPSEGPGIYIRGRVTTDDYGGNFYKSLCIQQIVDGKQQALRISLDASSASGMYPLGQELLIRCNGLAIGRYADQPQLCVPSYNNNYMATNAVQKVGWAPGRIPYERFQLAVTRIGLPDKSALQCDTLLISDFQKITSEHDMRLWDAKLVCIKNVHYTGTYENNGNLTGKLLAADPSVESNANVFAPTTNNVGFPQSRVVSDGKNNTLVSCSEYAKFAYYYIPGADAKGVQNCTLFSGNITGILGQYRDNGRYDHDIYDWSITPRDLNDFEFYDGAGDPWIPVEYGE